MKRKPVKQTRAAMPESVAYEASLTGDERLRLHKLVGSDKSMEEVMKEARPWPSGWRIGQPPSCRVIYEIKRRLRLEKMLFKMEASAMAVERTRSALKPVMRGVEGEKMLDLCLSLIGQEVITSTIEGASDEVRNSAARLLLKRADQFRVDRKLKLVEKNFQKVASGSLPDIGMTPEEKQERMKEILGI